VLFYLSHDDVLEKVIENDGDQTPSGLRQDSLMVMLILLISS
jgi:hypothetical protein